MRLLTTSLLIATLGLTACATVRDSSINPANWFGRSQSEPIQRESKAAKNPLIPEERRTGLFKSLRNDIVAYNGQPIDQVSGLVIERIPGGAIIRATGISSFDGAHSVQLTPATDDSTPVEGVLTYRLEAERPSALRRTTSQRVRTVTAAVRLSDNDLKDVRVIRVEGERNAQTTARR
ncbi:hypothetical protein [Tateyamaria sp.]|uniref:hypothetical protein n=1 Tax=Tateyamaria sp. TaxID=1929288 RepID=UPI00329C7195